MTNIVEVELQKSELQKRITNNFQSSINVKSASISVIKQPIVAASISMFNALSQNKKILSCGNGGSAADSQHFVAELVNRFQIERKPLAAISLTTDTSILTAIGNDYSYDLIFQKQVQALGQSGDIFVAISTSGNSKNIIKAVESAQQKNMKIILLTGNNGGKLAELMRPEDIKIQVPSTCTARIQETHILAIHCLCDAIDWQLQKTKERETI